MKSKSLNVLLILVISLTFIFIFVKESKSTRDLTLSNVEALADDEEEPRGYCMGVGNVDCDGKNYKYIIDIE